MNYHKTHLKLGMRSSWISCTILAQYVASNGEKMHLGNRQRRRKVVIASFFVVLAGNQFWHWRWSREKTCFWCSCCFACSLPSFSIMVSSRSFSRFRFPNKIHHFWPKMTIFGPKVTQKGQQKYLNWARNYYQLLWFELLILKFLFDKNRLVSKYHTWSLSRMKCKNEEKYLAKHFLFNLMTSADFWITLIFRVDSVDLYHHSLWSIDSVDNQWPSYLLLGWIPGFLGFSNWVNEP